MKRALLTIPSQKCCFKTVRVFQRNCALIVPTDEPVVAVHFVREVSAVSVRVSFPALKTAEAVPQRDGFVSHYETPKLRYPTVGRRRRYMGRNTRTNPSRAGAILALKSVKVFSFLEEQPMASCE